MNKVKVGIISFEHMHAYSYASCLQRLPGAELVGIADQDPRRGLDAAYRFKTPYYRDYQELLRQELDAVLICSANARHREHTVAAAQAGKHVMVEKPIATSVADGTAMVTACREAGVNLQIAFPSRFGAPTIRVKDLLGRGELGKVKAMVGTNHGRNPGGWFVDPALSGGGAVFDHTVHILDLMRWYTAEEPIEVFCEMDKLPDGPVIDEFGLVMVQFSGGSFGTIDTSWCHPANYPTWGDAYLRLVGEKGVLTLDVESQASRLYSSTGAGMEYWGDDYDYGLVAEFVASVREGRAPSVTGEDGVAATRVALAAYESFRTGRPVRLGQGAPC
jgi:UDP-N-acetylglucosamine 3-dehydrogenase